MKGKCLNTEIKERSPLTNFRPFRIRLADGRMRSWERPAIMGIINATPDSFYDGRPGHTVDDLLHCTEKMMKEGVDIVDVGGESTRPGAKSINEEEEYRRVIPVVDRLRRTFPDLLLSIDTTKVGIARAAWEAGGDIVNDISSGDASRGEMLDFVVEKGLPIILMHRKGTPRTMQIDPHYPDPVEEIENYLRSRVNRLLDRTFDPSSLILDPGIGFGKTENHNLAILRRIRDFSLGRYPVLIGASMKRIVGDLTGGTLEKRLPGTLGVHLACIQNGASIVRVHDVGAMRACMDAFYRIVTS